MKALLDEIRRIPLPPELLRSMPAWKCWNTSARWRPAEVHVSLAKGTPQARMTREKAKAALDRVR